MGYGGLRLLHLGRAVMVGVRAMMVASVVSQAYLQTERVHSGRHAERDVVNRGSVAVTWFQDPDCSVLRS